MEFNGLEQVKHNWIIGRIDNDYPIKGTRALLLPFSSKLKMINGSKTKACLSLEQIHLQTEAAVRRANPIESMVLTSA